MADNLVTLHLKAGKSKVGVLGLGRATSAVLVVIKQWDRDGWGGGIPSAVLEVIKFNCVERGTVGKRVHCQSLEKSCAKSYLECNL